MRRKPVPALCKVMTIGLALAVVPMAATAAARTSVKQSFKGVIVASGVSGTRTVVSTVVVAKGVITRAGRLVEVAPRPGDPDTLNRDDLVFGRGTLHLLTTTTSFTPSMDAQTCAGTVRIAQTQEIHGGTGAFRHATGRFSGTIRARGVAARNPDGTCSQELPELLEVATFSMHGTLSR